MASRTLSILELLITASNVVTDKKIFLCIKVGNNLIDDIVIEVNLPEILKRNFHFL